MKCYKCHQQEAENPLTMCKECHTIAVAQLKEKEALPVGNQSCSAAYELRPINAHAMSFAEEVKLNHTSRNGLRIKKGHHLS